MQKILLAAIALPCLLGLGTSASADNKKGWYAGIGVNAINSGELRDDGDDISFAGIEMLTGYKYDSYLGIELRVGVGTRGADDSTATTSVKVDVTGYEGLYYRMESASDSAKVYAMIGATHVATKRVTGQTEKTEKTLSGVGVGGIIGIGFLSGEKTNLNFEYRQYINNSDNSFSGITINIDRRF